MTQEYNMELFDKWTDTSDRKTYIELGKQLFPGEMTDEEWETRHSRGIT